MAFVMVLSCSRANFLRFFLDARMDSFLRGHVEAFAALGDARVLLYEGPASVSVLLCPVVQLQGFTPSIKEKKSRPWARRWVGLELTRFRGLR